MPGEPFIHQYGESGWHIRLNRVAWWPGVEVALVNFKYTDKVIEAAHAVESVEIEDGKPLPKIARLNDMQAQGLMDELWHCGFRPSEGSGSAGALAAVEAHRDDMRKLVFMTMHKLMGEG
jgi:hypothetical protein